MPDPQFNAWVGRARAVPIEREIDRRGVKLKRVGAERVGPCPKCNGDDRFAINPKKGLWNCRGCDVGGDVIELVQHLDDVDFKTACATLTGEQPPKANGKDRAGKRKIVVEEYPYRNEVGEVAFVVERREFLNPDGTFVVKDGKHKKTFRQKRPDPDHPGAWINNVDGVPVIPYQLPQVLEAIASDRPVLIVEGERKADLLAEWNVTATCNAGGAGKWRAEHSEFLRGADAVLLPDNDEAGYRHVDLIGTSLNGIAARIRVLVLPNLGPKGDIRDWAKAGGTREQLDALIEQAPHWQPPQAATPDNPDKEGKAKAEANDQALIDELSGLDSVQYDRRRDAAAEQLNVRRGTLDDAVDRRRRQRVEEQGPPPLFADWQVEPWNEAVATDELLLAIQERLQGHIVFTREQAIAATLWDLFSWVHDIAVHSPMCLVTSPERDSGKTTLINLMRYMMPRALSCVGITEASLFRGIELWSPSLVIDEADTILVNNEPLRTVINSGWTRGSGVPRCIGDEKVPHLYPTFAPKLIGMKGKKLPDTTLSRCVIIDMKRKRKNECVERFRNMDDSGLADLRRKARRWANDNSETLEHAVPVMLPEFDNRVSENWWLQLAIADLAGGQWPALARAAAKKLEMVPGDASITTQLLAATRAIFYPTDESELAPPDPLERVSSAELVARLASNPDSPWAEWKNGKAITQGQFARLLKPHGIAPQLIRLPGGLVIRGYLRVQFEECWGRYL
jgi:putative DNA primase/helicase